MFPFHFQVLDVTFPNIPNIHFDVSVKEKSIAITNFCVSKLLNH